MSQMPLSPSQLALMELAQQNFARDEALATRERQRWFDVVRRECGVPDGVNATIESGVMSWQDPPQTPQEPV